MKKIIFGNLLFFWITLQPLLGWWLFNTIGYPEYYKTVSAVAWCAMAVLQIIFATSLIHAGFKEEKIATPFTDDRRY